jgi:NitT/TauT family transport system ATP-binding protein
LDWKGLTLSSDGETGDKIRLRSLSKTFRASRSAAPTIALEDISLSVSTGQFACLVGPSGCGKSTILNLIAGFERPSSGDLMVDGEPVTEPGPDRGVVFQEPQLFPWLNVLDNITFGPRMNGVPARQFLPAAQNLIGNIGLTGFERHRPYELSGGMKQRVALARAWIGHPRVLLMDEPFAALDAQTRVLMQEELVSVWESRKITVVFVTHDVDEAILLADRIIVMTARPGRIKADIAVRLRRPRRYHDLIETAEAIALRREVFHLVREEAMKTMQSPKRLHAGAHHAD